MIFSFVLDESTLHGYIPMFVMVNLGRIIQKKNGYSNLLFQKLIVG